MGVAMSVIGTTINVTDRRDVYDDARFALDQMTKDLRQGESVGGTSDADSISVETHRSFDGDAISVVWRATGSAAPYTLQRSDDGGTRTSTCSTRSRPNQIFTYTDHDGVTDQVTISLDLETRTDTRAPVHRRAPEERDMMTTLDPPPPPRGGRVLDGRSASLLIGDHDGLAGGGARRRQRGAAPDRPQRQVGEGAGDRRDRGREREDHAVPAAGRPRRRARSAAPRSARPEGGRVPGQLDHRGPAGTSRSCPRGTTRRRRTPSSRGRCR